MDLSQERRQSSPKERLQFVFVISSIAATDGGPSNAVLQLASGIVRRGHAATVVSVASEGDVFPPAYYAALELGVVVKLVVVNVKTKWRYAARLALSLPQYVATSDGVSIHGFFQYPCLLAIWLCRLLRKQFVLQPHGVLEPYQQLHSRRIKQLFMLIGGKWALVNAVHVNAAAQVEELNIKTQYARASTQTIGMGVSRELLSLPILERREGERQILFMSRIAPKKRLDLLLRAVRDLASPHWRLVIAGSGDASYVDLLKQLAYQLGIQDKIEWVGHVDGDAKWRLLQTSHLLVLPSDNENFGQIVTEAMAAGLPVITTDQVGASVHVSQAGAGIVVSSGDVDLIRHSLDSLLSSPSTLARMAVDGKSYSKKNLDWLAVADNFLGSWQLAGKRSRLAGQ